MRNNETQSRLIEKEAHVVDNCSLGRTDISGEQKDAVIQVQSGTDRSHKNRLVQSGTDKYTHEQISILRYR